LFDLGRNVRYIAALLNSKAALYLLRAINPTLAFNPGDVAKLPIILTADEAMFRAVDSMAQEVIEAHKVEWEAKEESWGFTGLLLIDLGQGRANIAESWNALQQRSVCMKQRCRHLEEELNHIFNKLYRLSDEVSSEVEDVDPSLM